MLFGRPPDIEKLKAARDVGGLVKALGNRDQSIAPDPRTLIPLVAAVLEKSPEIGEAAIEGLAKFDKEQVAKEVLRRISVDQDAFLTYAPIAAQAGWEVTGKTLSYVRQEAEHRVTGGRLLERLAGAEAAKAVISACEDRRRKVYDATAESLVKFADAVSLPELQEAAQNGNEDVRGFAELVLGRMREAGVKG